MNAGGFVELLRLWHGAARTIRAAMRDTSLSSVGTLGPFALHPFEISKPRTINEFVDHTRWY